MDFAALATLRCLFRMCRICINIVALCIIHSDILPFYSRAAHRNCIKFTFHIYFHTDLKKNRRRGT